VEGSKESRGSTVTIYGYPAAAYGGYVGASSSSRVAFRVVGVEVSYSAAAGLAGCLAGVGVLLQMSIRDCCCESCALVTGACALLAGVGFAACFGWSWAWNCRALPLFQLLGRDSRFSPVPCGLHLAVHSLLIDTVPYSTVL
jgi:hypothetical protein